MAFEKEEEEVEYSTFSVSVGVDRKRSDNNYGSNGRNYHLTLGGTLDPMIDSPMQVLSDTRDLLMELARESMTGVSVRAENIQAAIDGKHVRVPAPKGPDGGRMNTASQVEAHLQREAYQVEADLEQTEYRRRQDR